MLGKVIPQERYILLKHLTNTPIHRVVARTNHYEKNNQTRGEIL